MLSLYRLPNILPGEKIVKVVRRDTFIIFKRIVLFAGLLVLPLGFLYIMTRIHPGLMHGTISLPIVILSVSAYYLFTWLFFFFSFIDYYLDVWIITDRRVIDIEQRGFFSRVIAEHKLFRIQDVTSEVHGIIPTLLKFGDVHVQTAGTKQRFHFHQITNPNKVRDLLIKLVQRNRAHELKKGGGGINMHLL